MAKSDFICRPCNEVKASGYLRGRKYECPQHGTLCSRHIEAHVLGRDKCRDCENQGDHLLLELLARGVGGALSRAR